MSVDLLVVAPPMRAFPDSVVGPVVPELRNSTFVGLRRSDASADPRGAMMIGLFYLAVLATVPLAGGRLSALADVPLRKPGIALAAILLQVLIISIVPEGSHVVPTSIHIASYVLLGVFAWVNRRIAGVPVIALGGFSNFLAI